METLQHHRWVKQKTLQRQDAKDSFQECMSLVKTVMQELQWHQMFETI